MSTRDSHLTAGNCTCGDSAHSSVVVGRPVYEFVATEWLPGGPDD